MASGSNAVEYQILESMPWSTKYWSRKQREMETHSDSAPMNGGNGAHSYSKNSFYQKQFADLVKDKIVEVISAKLDVKSLCSVSSVPLTLADLGCSVGPNTVIAMQNFMEAIKLKYQHQGPAHSQILPQFQVFFNDQVLNDFNTLFRSLPQDRQYFAAGVAGSFYGRLFPESSIHFVYSSTALHWLSRVPEELRDRNSAAWNRGRIHYTSAPNEVIKAYSAHFAKDMQIFFDARAKEIVSGGMMVLIIPASDDKLPRSQDAIGITFNCMASSLMDIVKLGIIAEDEVDSFNIPMYCPCPNEMEEVIEKNGNFNIETMESLLAASALKGRPINIPEWVAHIRAAMEGNFTRHFGSENIVDEIFQRLTEKLIALSEGLEGTRKFSTSLLLVLKRK